MQNLVRSLLSVAGLMLAGLFYDIEIVYCLGLVLGGLFLLPFPHNWWEVMSMVCLGMIGILTVLEYNWAPILFSVSGLLLVIGQPINNIPLSSYMKYILGWCLLFSAITFVLFLSGLLVMFHILFVSFEHGDEELARMMEYNLE